MSAYEVVMVEASIIALNYGSLYLDIIICSEARQAGIGLPK